MIELMMVELIYQCDKFTYGEYDFSSMGSWSYSSEWVQDLRPNCVALLLQPSGMSAVLHSSNLTSGIYCFKIPILNESQCPNA